MDIQQFQQSEKKSEIKRLVQNLDSVRKGEDAAEVTFAEAVKDKWDMGVNDLFEELGINPDRDTISNIFNLPDENVRWLVPEIIRDSMRLGLRKAPIWSSVIVSEESVNGLQVTMPYWNMSEADLRIVNEGETIPKGDMSFDSKIAKVHKMGRGIKITDEVRNYVSVNTLSIYLEDLGMRLGMQLDTMAIDVLINGEQPSGSESAPAVGVNTSGTVEYEDILRIWVRMSRLGRSPSVMIGGESAAINTMLIPEFKEPVEGTPEKGLDVRSSIPNQTAYFIHSAVPTDKQIIVDPSSAMIKLNAQPLTVESDRIISNQTEETYASLTTGFAIIWRDGRFVLNQSVDFSTAPFPAFTDPSNQENAPIN